MPYEFGDFCVCVLTENDKTPLLSPCCHSSEKITSVREQTGLSPHKDHLYLFIIKQRRM